MQCGTVRGAAAMLHITQPAATRLLQQAERQCGFSLFDRVRGRLVPTHEARLLYPEVEQLYLKLGAVRQLVRNLGAGEDVVLKVLCVPALAQEGLPQALAQVRQRHRAARFAVRTLHSGQIAQALALREADIGLTFEPPAHPALVAEAVVQGQIVAVGGPRQRLPRALRLTDLAQRPVIDLAPDDPLGRRVHAAREAAGLVFDAPVVAQSYHAALALARAGLGIALVDSFTAAAAQRLDPTVSVAALTPALAVQVHAIRLREAPVSALAHELVSSLRQALMGQT